MRRISSRIKRPGFFLAFLLAMGAPGYPLAREAGWLAGTRDDVVVAEATQAEHYHTLEEKKAPSAVTKLAERFSVSGLIEGEWYSDRNDAAGNDSEAVLATVQLGLNAKITPQLGGSILLLWEENNTEPMEVDEAYLRFKSEDGFGVKAGRFYLPFGVFTSHFVSDPFTLGLGETRKEAVVVSYRPGSSGWPSWTAGWSPELSAGAFDGNTGNGGANIVATATITPRDGLSFAVFYISDMAETNAGLMTSPYKGKGVHGRGASFTFTEGGWDLSAEYIGAGERFSSLDLDADGNGKGDWPQAYNVELAYRPSEHIEFAARYEGSSEFFAFPESQWGLAVSYHLFDGVTLKMEHLRGAYYVGGDRDLTSAQIALAF
ncbi:MAG: LbtU family siderophore porin [Deltaproteobacteria bacterium]|nr:LbtU family siderophore porin [Deltaproteobacteria bacterium]